MNDHAEQVLLSDELLGVMRNAGSIAIKLREPFITTRALLLSLLDDPLVGPALADVVSREEVEGLPPPDDVRAAATTLLERGLEAGERAAMQRYDTLAFKLGAGKNSLWLSHDAFNVFVEGGRRAEGRYLPKHLAFGIAAEAIHSPGILAALHVSPGELSDAVLKL